MVDRVLDREIDRSYLERYQEKDNADDIIYELDEIITQLDNLRDSKDMNTMYAFAYCHICDSINLLLNAKESFERKIEELKDMEE